jgi:hypothetical protein
LESLPTTLCTGESFEQYYGDGEDKWVTYDDSTHILSRNRDMTPLSTFANKPYTQRKAPRFSSYRILNKFHAIAQSISNSPTLSRLRRTGSGGNIGTNTNSTTSNNSSNSSNNNNNNSCNSPLVPHNTQNVNAKFEEMFYFEVTMVEGKVQEQLSAGVGICEAGYPADTFVGWRYESDNLESIAYHADDGLKRYCDDYGKTYGPSWDGNDTVGVGLHYVGKNEANVFFTKNGQYLGVAQTVTNKQWYPALGHSMKLKMKVNFGQEAFVFDVKQYMTCCKVGSPMVTPKGQAQKSSE